MRRQVFSADNRTVYQLCVDQVLVKECKNLRELRVGMKSNPGTRYEITDSWVYQVINFSTNIEVLKVRQKEPCGLR